MNTPKFEISSVIIHPKDPFSPTILKSNLLLVVESKISPEVLNGSFIPKENIIKDIFNTHKEAIINKIKSMVGIDDELRYLIHSLVFESLSIGEKADIYEKIEEKLFRNNFVVEQIISEINESDNGEYSVKKTQLNKKVERPSLREQDEDYDPLSDPIIKNQVEQIHNKYKKYKGD